MLCSGSYAHADNEQAGLGRDLAELGAEKIDLWAGEHNICPSQKRKEEISRAIGGE